MSAETHQCVSCDTDVPTLPDVTPICSDECKRDWLQEQFNSMTDEHAHCPICESNHETVTDALYHHNHQHTYTIHRMETCKYCGEEFTPENWSNPNKYCSETCFGLSDSGGRPFEGYVTYECCRDDCEQKNTVTKAVRRLMLDEPYCSPSCSTAGPEHPLWQGGSDDIRSTVEYRQWKKTVHASAVECESCGSSSNLQAHHIVPVSVAPEKACDPSNGKLLCGACHSEKHPDLAEELFR